uniref:Cytochrome c biogenesis protein CcsA n=1 Tax=Monomastix sp. (strain OKE-1) TaxID=141716 RepID=C0JWN0_MONSK|nr:cytochrome c biogenesis protein [Monomastix sp. OKE-1]ACK36890.1 protein involved in cytochrome c biogenesis [Monomastix sp. OKE-1]
MLGILELLFKCFPSHSRPAVLRRIYLYFTLVFNMDSENLIFLTLFFSVVLSLWSWTSVKPNQPFLVQESTGGNLSKNSKTLFQIKFEEFFIVENQNFGILLSSVFVFGANFLLSFLLLMRWIDSGHPPFSNLYESLLFLTWSLLFLYFPTVGFWGKDLSKTKNSSKLQEFTNTEVLKKAEFGKSNEIHKTVLPMAIVPTGNPSLRISTSLKSVRQKESLPPEVSSLAGIVLVSAALFIYTFATWVLPAEMREIKPLVPALKSNWLLMHVSIMLLSYSALLAGSLFSILYLVLFYFNKNKTEPTKLTTKSSDQKSVSEIPQLNGNISFPQLKQFSKQRFLTDLDSLSYRSLAFAFPLLTLGIISGAVWANEAWGSYWSWDPKETWALITWFTFSIYLHLRIQKSWEGEKAALVAAFGFFVVWVCYLGVNLLGKGLHSYGWWNS